MTVKTEGQHAGEFLISEGEKQYSRDSIVINAGAGKLSAGTLVAQITAANAASATAGANTGDGTVGAIGVDNTAITGDYIVTITEAAADGGAFIVVDPNGTEVGSGTVGVEFTGGGLTFTIADGATDFAVNDSWTIAVNAGIGEWVAYDNDGTDDGRRACGGVLFDGVDATLSDARAVGIVRHAQVRASDLVGLDADGIADLKSIGVIVR
jgi:hypothetical protein